MPKKRKINKEGWKASVRKNKRAKGEAYVGSKGAQRPAKPMLCSPCDGKAKHVNCNNISEESRKILYEKFRGMANIDDQRSFIKMHIENKPKARITRNLTESRRNFTVTYYLTVDSQRIKVCRRFFLATFNITDSLIRSVVAKTTAEGCLEKDKRGKHPPPNKLPQTEEEHLEKHIASFPAVESHYCRKSTGRKYLDKSLNVQIMHKMYVEECKKNSLKPVSISKYRQVFRRYNLGFFKPKKDQCKFCLAYKAFSSKKQEEEKSKFELHMAKKESARRERDLDKEVSQSNKKIIAFNFDLQAVLTTPKGPSGQIFYMRKLAVYNLTVYNLGNQKVLCYVWDETQGKRGANEIATCIFEYISNQKDDVESIRMMSDGCGGQQKNSIFATMCLRLVQTHPSLKTIDHKFFETGHTEMECDSIHSKIERKSKYIPVYTPESWAQIIRSARNNPFPFEVNMLTFDDFINFKLVSSNVTTNIPWRRVCWLRYEKDSPYTIFYKTDFQGDFQTAEIRGKRGRKVESLQKVYSACMPISNAKHKDLMKMCEDYTIPKAYHSFYKSIKFNDSERDCLPEPDAEENSEYENE